MASPHYQFGAGALGPGRRFTTLDLYLIFGSIWHPFDPSRTVDEAGGSGSGADGGGGVTDGVPDVGVGGGGRAGGRRDLPRRPGRGARGAAILLTDGSDQAPVLLVPQTAPLPAQTSSYLRSLSGPVQSVVAYGGSSAVGNSVAAAVQGAVRS